MTQVYLRYENAAGSGDGVELYPGKSYILPNEAPNIQGIDVVEKIDGSHSMTKLVIYEQDVLISAYGSNRTEVLEAPGGIGRYKVPISTLNEERQIYIVLRRGDQILTPSGRWSLVWRTGESQMSLPTQTSLPNAARSFDASLEIEDNQSQENKGSIPHDAVDNYVSSTNVLEDGTHAPASVLMPPPSPQQADIVLDTSDPNGDHGTPEIIATVHHENIWPEHLMQDQSALVSDTQPSSQGIRTALSELSTKNVIVHRRDVGTRPQTPPKLNGGLLQDENSNLLNQGDSSAKLKAQIDDVNTRRILQATNGMEEENVVTSRNLGEGGENAANDGDDNGKEKVVRIVDVEASIMGGSAESTQRREALGAELTIGVVQHRLETLVTKSPVHDTNAKDQQPAPNASSTSGVFPGEAERPAGNQGNFVSPEFYTDIVGPVPAGGPSMTLEPRKILPSGSSRKRKTPTYSHKDRSFSKHGKRYFEESHSNHEQETVTVEFNTKRSESVSTMVEKKSPGRRHTTRTPKPTPKSTFPTSLTKSMKPRIGRSSLKVTRDRAPSRSRSNSIASSSHFTEYLGSPPRVIFSSTTTVDEKKNTMKDFSRLGGEKVESIERANMLIVGGTSLRKTAKLITAVARGMDVVNERWIVESRRKGTLLDIVPFLPEDEEQQALWGTTLADAIARGKEGIVKELLQDTTVYTTKDLDRGTFSRDLLSVVKALGGNIVKGSLPSAKSRTRKFLILGTRQDAQAVEVQRMGHKLFDKDLIILGGLHGKIETESPEFEIGVPVKEEDSQ